MTASGPAAQYVLHQFTEYADHQSWRCKYPDRYPWWDDDGTEDDCCCGLLSTARLLGLDDMAEGMLKEAREHVALMETDFKGQAR